MTERVRRVARALPLQFWLLATGSFVFLSAMGLAFPYTTLFIHERLGVSMAVVGLIMGGAAIVGLPLQVIGGHVSDRFGRRPVLFTSFVATGTLYLGLALSAHLWQVVLVVFCERAFGWPMFLASSNAMVADLVPLRRRPEAYSVLRFSIMTGYVAGPALAGLALAAGATLPHVFILAGVACILYVLPAALVLRETHPERRSGKVARAVAAAAGGGTAPSVGLAEAAAVAGGATPDAGGHGGSRGARAAGAAGLAARGSAEETASSAGGYRVVFRDRRFLALCAVALLPLFCLGQVYNTLPVVATTELGLTTAGWGMLISTYALVAACLQIPLVRATRRRDAMLRLALASAGYGTGLGCAVLFLHGWWVLAALALMAVGEVLLSPVSSTVVTAMAPADLRGRYLGAWTLVWMFGMSLGPITGGFLLDVLGGRGLYALVLAAGLAGAAGFLLLPRRRRVRLTVAVRRLRRA